jgi:hypothetical protein
VALEKNLSQPRGKEKLFPFPNFYFDVCKNEKVLLWQESQ